MIKLSCMKMENDHCKTTVTTIENRGTGKVARLPKDIREIVNRLIEDGCTYLYIIKRLEELGLPASSKPTFPVGEPAASKAGFEKKKFAGCNNNKLAHIASIDDSPPTASSRLSSQTWIGSSANRYQTK